jgi:hypothetical protein
MSEFTRKFAARQISSIDQQIQVLRTGWMEASPGERDEFEAYLREVEKLRQPRMLGHCLIFPIRLAIAYQLNDENGEVAEEGRADLAPRLILDAIEAWKQESLFTPESSYRLNS